VEFGDLDFSTSFVGDLSTSFVGVDLATSFESGLE
jgi:hypothetical protein